MNVTEDAIAQGFEHIETLADLHFHKAPEERLEAMTLVMESFGMDEEARAKLIETLDTFVPERLQRARGWVIMGFLAGLSSAQNAEPE